MSFTTMTRDAACIPVLYIVYVGPLQLREGRVWEQGADTLPLFGSH